MVSLLALGLVLSYNVAGIHPDTSKFDPTAPMTTILPDLPTNWPVGLAWPWSACCSSSGRYGGASPSRPR